MRRFRRNIIAIALSTLLLVAVSSAQQTSTTAVPNLIRYSGTLKDAQGAVPSGTPLGVTFAIYKLQDGGAPVWQETQNVTPDASGQYSVVLGSTTASGLPDDLFLQQEQRWLGVQVQGEAEQTRVLLVSVPYAFKAHEAETLGGLPPSAFVKAPPADASDSGSAGANKGTSVANTGSTSNVKNAAGPLSSCSSLTSIVGGIPNQISIWDGLCDLVSSGIYQSGFPGGPVGILNPAPIADLDVNGAINVSPTSSSNTGNYEILESPVLSIGWPSKLTVVAKQNLSVGVLAGAQGFNQGSTTLLTGTGNTLVGYAAAFHNQSGSANTAVGVGAGYRNITGNNNTYVGVDAAFGVFGKVVSNNTIMGYQSGFKNDASNGSFYGYQAGSANTADGNSFFGFSAGRANTSGNSNTFLGNSAGIANTTGAGNTFVGAGAGSAEKPGVSNNIEIGNTGPAYEFGVTTNCPSTPCSKQILIGTLGVQTDTYIQGIYGAPNPATFLSKTVCVDSNGKLWGGFTNDPHCDIIVSSRRFKEQVLDMGDSSSKLFELRPVTFFYKPQYDDGSHALQYGLIAEEVAKVDPHMVVYDKDDQPYSVKYQVLAPMLLNELQKQHTVVAAQQDVIKTQQEQIQTQGQQIADLQERLSRLESLIAKK